MSLEYLTLTLFTIFNGIRIFGYFPQIVRSANDTSGAASTSMMAWLTFGCANTSSAAYAFVNNKDWLGAAMFGVNALCCAAIGGVTFWKRLAAVQAEARMAAAGPSRCTNPICPMAAGRPISMPAMPVSVAAARAARQHTPSPNEAIHPRP